MWEREKRKREAVREGLVREVHLWGLVEGEKKRKEEKGGHPKRSPPVSCVSFGEREERRKEKAARKAEKKRLKAEREVVESEVTGKPCS